MKAEPGFRPGRRGSLPLPLPAVALLLACFAAGPVGAQDADPPRTPGDPAQLFDPFVPPVGGAWEPVSSLGQPSRWEFSLGGGYGMDRYDPDETVYGGTVSFGAMRHLFSPVYGFLALGGQLYGGHRGGDLDGGAQLFLESSVFMAHAGLDWNARLERVDPLFGASFPLRRGGFFGRGGQVRVDYLPFRSHSLRIGATLPLFRPLAGRTRPRTVDVELPARPARLRASPRPLPDDVGEAVEEVREAMERVTELSTFFWLTEDERLSHQATVRQWREILGAFRRELEERDDERAGAEGSSYEWKVEAYHETLDRAFGRALGASRENEVAVGRPFADRARRTVLEEVILPYNRTIGQHKERDRLDGLVARARARWVAWADLTLGVRDGAHETAAVLDAWLALLEDFRRDLSKLTGDSRMHWLPLALALRPEEHRTRSQIDGIIELALGRDFEGGNALLYLDAPQFQPELLRTVRETEAYHVLWIHDFRGRGDDGEPDWAGFELATQGYLRALTDAVWAYDETGRLPVFMIFHDQHFYELNDGRLWLDLLENPLHHRVRLPESHALWREEVEILQDSLRLAVESSRRLQAEAEAFGEEWLERVVKVHVNVTNPSDFSFRTRRLPIPPFGPDNLIRDHRKIVIRDVFKDDPERGEVILAGIGVGDRYTSPSWDDRALIIQGPAAVQAVPHARAILLRHGMEGDEIPYPLRYRPRASDHASRVAALEEAGATARVLQVHNRTGWGPKDATFVQMLLYDLAPPGTVIFVPDSHWTSFQWMAQLVSAALRGCHVYVVAPSRRSAPTTGFHLQSAMQELVSRLAIIEEVFGDRIREGGGDLRLGLFTREVPLDDVPGLVAELEETFDENPFLRELLPFPEDTWRRMHEVAGGDGSDVGWGEPFVAGGPEARRSEGGEADETEAPFLHRKTQWIVDREVLRALASSPELAGLKERELERIRRGPVVPPEGRSLLARERVDTSLALLRVLAEIEGVDEESVLYFATGSLNKNVRSMALDGEAMAVVSGPWAMQSFFDLALLSGGIDWVRSLEEVETLFPPFSNFRRRISRLLHKAL